MGEVGCFEPLISKRNGNPYLDSRGRDHRVTRRGVINRCITGYASLWCANSSFLDLIYNKQRLGGMMTISKRQVFRYLALALFISFSVAAMSFLTIAHYREFARHSYLFGLLSTFGISAVALTIMAAILEELGFRGFLTTNKYLFVAGSAMFLTYVEGSIFYRFILDTHVAHSPLAIILSYEHVIYFLPENLVLMSLLVLKFGFDLPGLVMRHRGVFVFASSVVFGLAHTTNLWATAVPWYFPLVFVLPQFFFGLLMCRVRLGYNLRSSMILHFCYDFSLLLLGAAVKSTGLNPVVHVGLAAAAVLVICMLYFCGFFFAIAILKRVVGGRRGRLVAVT